MIFVLIALLALAVLAPVLLVLRSRIDSRGTRDLTVELHRTQLRELDRDLAEGRILPAEHVTAKLEVQRRLLAAAGTDDAAASTGKRWPVLATLILVPVAAIGLYAVSGSKPMMPSSNGSAEQAKSAEEASLIEGSARPVDPARPELGQGTAGLRAARQRRGTARQRCRCGRRVPHGVAR